MKLVDIRKDGIYLYKRSRRVIATAFSGKRIVIVPQDGGRFRDRRSSKTVEPETLSRR